MKTFTVDQIKAFAIASYRQGARDSLLNVADAVEAGDATVWTSGEVIQMLRHYAAEITVQPMPRL